MWKIDNPQVVELLTRVLSDVEPPEGRMVYLFGQTSDNQTSVLDTGVALWHRDHCLIAVCDGETEHGYPGWKVWEEELLRRGGVPRNYLHAVKVEGNVNTLTEAQAVVRYAKASAWEDIIITAAQFHQLRAFVTTASVVLREYPALRVYNKVGRTLNWHKRVRHSQGTREGTRIELIHVELDRLQRYYEKGHLVSPREVLDYLNRRDGAT